MKCAPNNYFKNLSSIGISLSISEKYLSFTQIKCPTIPIEKH